ncbi:MAG: hypothetical protein Alpg2KO_00380 [Alphaproteobacteria bacterium]
MAAYYIAICLPGFVDMPHPEPRELLLGLFTGFAAIAGGVLTVLQISSTIETSSRNKLEAVASQARQEFNQGLFVVTQWVLSLEVGVGKCLIAMEHIERELHICKDTPVALVFEAPRRLLHDNVATLQNGCETLITDPPTQAYYAGKSVAACHFSCIDFNAHAQRFITQLDSDIRRLATMEDNALRQEHAPACLKLAVSNLVVAKGECERLFPIMIEMGASIINTAEKALDNLEERYGDVYSDLHIERRHIKEARANIEKTRVGFVAHKQPESDIDLGDDAQANTQE